jgi:malonate transporter
MLQIFLTSLPIFLLIGFGCLIRLVRLADEGWVGILNKYGLYIAYPALIVKNLVELGALNPALIKLLLLNVILLNVVLMVIYLLARLFKCRAELAATFAVCGFYGNIAYLGFPFITSVYPGTEGSVILHIAIYVFVMFSSGIFLLEKLKSDAMPLKEIAVSILKNPLVASLLLGLGLRGLHVPVPAPVKQALGMAAASASPVVLVALGIFMGRGLRADRDLFHAGILTGLKIVLLPGIFLGWAALWAPGGGFNVSILESAMPVGLTAFALSQIYPMNRNVAAYAVIMSTILSMITLPILSGLLR